MRHLQNIQKHWQNIDSVKSLQLFQLLRYGAIILTNILLAKSTLALADIGVYETLMFLATGATFFWVSGLLKGMLTTYPPLNKEEKRQFLFNAFLTFQVLSALTAGLFFIFEENILRLFTDYHSLPHFHLLCLYLLLNIPTYLVEYIYLLTKQPKGIVKFGFFAFTSHIIVVALPIFLGYTLQESFYGLIVLALFKYLWMLTLLLKNSQIAYRPQLITPFLLLSIPLIINLLVAGGAEYIDGIIIQHYFDKETFAIFRYGAKELPLALALTGAFSAALIPAIAQNLEEGVEQIKAKSRQMIHLLYLVSIALMLLSPYLFPLVFSSDFQESAWVFNLYLLVLTSRVWFPQTILIGQKKTAAILWISIIELFVNVGLSLLLVNIWGIYGIALATVIAYMLDKILLAIYTYKIFGIKPSQYLDIRLYTIYSLALVGSFFMSIFYYT